MALWNNKKNNTSENLYSTAIYSTRAPALIDEELALTVPTVKSAVELISSSIAQLPIYLYVEDEKKNIGRVEDKRVSTLNHEANLHDTAQVIKKKIVQDYLLRGIAYLYKNNGKLFFLEAKNMKPTYYTDDGFTMSERVFIYYGDKTVELYEEDLIIIDSGTNGLLADSGTLFNTALQHLQYQESLMTTGAVPIGLLKSTARLTEKAIERLRQSWDNLYSGAKKTGKTLILEEGLDYSPLGMKPDEMGLHDSHKQIVSEIARVFNIPESMINATANKYNSLEANSKQFLQTCLAPIILGIESAFDKNLLNPTEKQLGYFFRFDTAELIRTTEKEKIENVATKVDKGLISMNEARASLDMKPVEKDFFLYNLGSAVRYEDGTWSIPNMGILDGQKQEDGGTQPNENGTKKQPSITEL